MNRDEILKTAQQYVSFDRNQEYGEPEDNFALIGDYWSVYLGGMVSDFPDAYDVALMMSLMKIARASKRPKNADSLIDLAGYAACAGEILENGGSLKAAGPVTMEELAQTSKKACPLPVGPFYPAPSQPDD